MIRKILNEVADLKEKKSADYQGGLFSENDYFPYGQQSYNHMLWTKILRIRSISEQNGEQNFESLEDSLKDLIAYAAMNISYLRDSNKTQPDIQPSSAETYQTLEELEVDWLRGKIGSKLYWAERERLDAPSI